jgi:hypothetical protein
MKHTLLFSLAGIRAAASGCGCGASVTHACEARHYIIHFQKEPPSGSEKRPNLWRVGHVERTRGEMDGNNHATAFGRGAKMTTKLFVNDRLS